MSRTMNILTHILYHDIPCPESQIIKQFLYNRSHTQSLLCNGVDPPRFVLKFSTQAQVDRYKYITVSSELAPMLKGFTHPLSRMWAFVPNPVDYVLNLYCDFREDPRKFFNAYCTAKSVRDLLALNVVDAFNCGYVSYISSNVANYTYINFSLDQIFSMPVFDEPSLSFFQGKSGEQFEIDKRARYERNKITTEDIAAVHNHVFKQDAAYQLLRQRITENGIV